jgi:hypothetical protein
MGKCKTVLLYTEVVFSLKDFAIKDPSLLFLRVSNEVMIDFHIESMLAKQ